VEKVKYESSNIVLIFWSLQIFIYQNIFYSKFILRGSFTEEGSRTRARIQIRIYKSEVRIRRSGSVAKCHGSGTLVLWILPFNGCSFNRWITRKLLLLNFPNLILTCCPATGCLVWDALHNTTHQNVLPGNQVHFILFCTLVQGQGKHCRKHCSGSVAGSGPVGSVSFWLSHIR
jgi:hypothetical protein